MCETAIDQPTLSNLDFAGAFDLQVLTTLIYPIVDSLQHGVKCKRLPMWNVKLSGSDNCLKVEHFLCHLPDAFSKVSCEMFLQNIERGELEELSEIANNSTVDIEVNGEIKCHGLSSSGSPLQSTTRLCVKTTFLPLLLDDTTRCAMFKTFTHYN